MTKPIHPILITFSVGIIAITTYISILVGINILKYFSALLHISILLLSCTIILKYKNNINWNIFVPILFILSIYPLTRIFIDSFNFHDFKKITDGLFVKGGYYQLPIIATALAILSQSSHFNPKKLFAKYSKWFLPIGFFIISILMFKQAKTGGIGIAYLVFNNCLIPSSMLAFFPSPKRYYYVGLLSILSIIFLSAFIASRSYFLVGLILILVKIFDLSKKSKSTIIFIACIILVAYLIGFFSIFTESRLIANQSIIEKFDFDSLMFAIKQFIHSPSLEAFSLWEGNSRAGIVTDAFKFFTFKDYLIGKGILGTYISFVERSTLEMGWAQEVFRWGLPYFIIILFIFTRGLLKIRRNLQKNKDLLLNVLTVIITIRILDGFVYGESQISVYNLLFFWGVMLQCIKTNSNHLKNIRFKKIKISI